MTHRLLWTLVLLPGFIACNNTPPPVSNTSPDEQVLMALLYQQKAAEYRALCLQAYHIAGEKVAAAARNQRSALPLAVVTDLDETALDNSANEAWLYQHDTTFWPAQFNQWCTYAAADSIPGSVQFFRFVDGLKDRKGRKIDIYYVSNRDDSLAGVTRKNMDSLGFPQLSREHFLFKKGGSSSKQTRRNSIAAGHVIVALLGDNLADHDSAFDGKDMDARRLATDRLSAEWGTRYIVFPNATYGDWEGALYKAYIKEQHKYPGLAARDSIRKSLLKAYP